jgi:hypothetical protein
LREAKTTTLAQPRGHPTALSIARPGTRFRDPESIRSVVYSLF